MLCHQYVCGLIQAHRENDKISIDRLITSKDHASVQISIVDVDAEGKALQTSTTFAFCGQVRANGESDDSLNRLATKAGCECSRVRQGPSGLY